MTVHGPGSAVGTREGEAEELEWSQLGLPAVVLVDKSYPGIALPGNKGGCTGYLH